MPIRLPFTNILIGTAPTLGKRGLAFGRFWASDPEKDYTGMRLSVDTLYNAYRVQGDVYACVRELREGIGRKGFELVDKNGEELKKENAVYKETTLILNSQKPWRKLKSETVRDMYVTGNAFWELVKNTQGSKITGINRIDPRTIAIVATEHGDIVRYVQKVGGKTVIFEVEDVIYFKMDSDPQYEIFGFSPLESILLDVRTDVSASISNYAFFKNNAQPAAYYLLDPALDDKEQNTAIENIKNQFKGAENRHKSAVLGGVKDIKTVSVTQKDMEFLAGRAFSTDKICAAFGVPKFMLGYTEKVNYQNSVSIMSVFADNTITPAEEDFAGMITDELLPALGFKGYSFRFNPQNVAEEKELEARALLEVDLGILTRKQYKIKTRQDVTPEDEANPMYDVHIVNQGMGAMPLENVGIEPIAEPIEEPDVKA